MKPTNLLNGRYLLPILVLIFSIGLISWDYQQKSGQTPQNGQDTLPKKVKEKKVKDLDEVLAELDRTDFQAEMEKVQAELAKAAREFDGEKIRMEIEKAMKEVDMAKIQQEVQAGLAKADWEKMKTEMEKVKQIDMKELEAGMKKMAEEMKEMGPKIEAEMKKAKQEIEKAKAEIKEYKGFVDGLDSDGLIKKKEGYTLKHQDGVLLINGKKASDGTYKKYQDFLEKHPKFNLNFSDDEDEVIEL